MLRTSTSPRLLLSVGLLLTSAGASASVPRLQEDGPHEETPASAAQEASGEEPEAQISEEQILAAWARLEPAEKIDLIEWFRSEVVWIGTFQASLLSYASALSERDPGLWPEPARAPVYDPALHSPAQPIPRRWLRADDKRAARLRQRIFAPIPKRRLESAWIYDYASGQPLRRSGLNDVERTFRNALQGFAPGVDLAEVLVERALDDGQRRSAFAAFAHAYTDRSGNVYPGVTLYDARAAGVETEMPDVDCLGIVHELTDDWSTWRAPVRKQESLYAKIEELFGDVHRRRGLRHAFALCYLSGDAVLRDGYAGHVDLLHALWEQHSSDPARLAEVLPGSEDWSEFLTAWAERCQEEPELLRKGVRRKQTLAENGRRVRARLLRIMKEFGAFEPRSAASSKPAPVPPPVPEAGQD